MPESPVVIETKAGATVQAGGNQITPLAQVVRLGLPGIDGGLIWNRPVAVRVKLQDSQEQVLPVIDVTRLAQITVLGLGLLGSLLIWLLWRKRI